MVLESDKEQWQDGRDALTNAVSQFAVSMVSKMRMSGRASEQRVAMDKCAMGPQCAVVRSVMSYVGHNKGRIETAEEKK